MVHGVWCMVYGVWMYAYHMLRWQQDCHGCKHAISLLCILVKHRVVSLLTQQQLVSSACATVELSAPSSAVTLDMTLFTHTCHPASKHIDNRSPDESKQENKACALDFHSGNPKP